LPSARRAVNNRVATNDSVRNRSPSQRAATQGRQVRCSKRPELSGCPRTAHNQGLERKIPSVGSPPRR
jgi:hypothetical protein